ncbi:VCBS repeat-containing protein [Piscibacillus sp. B03]|uniref:VCBS repeat-containing protein n=1 Tax=Piscibacillus sp. B03 TaxID=3457430 RepID=UPI003FCEDFA7
MFDYRQEPQVVAFAQGDVTGDGVMDNVYLTGVHTPDSPFVQDITLVIQDGLTGRFNMTPLSDGQGYDPTLFLGDFTGDGVSEIMISIATGGSGGIMTEYIYSYLDHQENLLFDGNAYNEAYQYQVTYLDDYKIQVVSESNQQQYIIDISVSRDQDYLDDIYNADGTLISPISGWVNPLSGLYPVDFDSNGVYELLAYQRIAGQYNADSFGYVLNQLAWEDDAFVLDQQSVAIFGSDL